jgi:uncharacterized membrane protein YGL010W
MDQATALLVQYARYHRDPRNIATHYVGIPLIVFAIGALLARVQFNVATVAVGLDGVAYLLAALWYLRQGQRPLALVTLALIGALLMLAHPLAQAPLATWLSVALGSFVVGWVFQFVGHYWEGRKPAFVDDLRGLLVGPMFVVAEAGFALGLAQPLQQHIVQQTGPVARQTPRAARNA